MPRRLRPEEEALWRRVAERTKPLNRDRRAFPAATSPDPPSRTGPAPTFPIQSFRVGEAARSDAPPVSAPPRSLRIDRRLQKDLSRGRSSPEASIDLHGMTLAEAHPALTRFILASFATGRRLVLVITGKGERGENNWQSARGILRRQVPDWLAGPGLDNIVQEVLPAHRSHGGAGALYVILRRG